MSRAQRLLEAPAPTPEEPHRDHDVTHRPRQLKGWRTVAELMEELRFPSEDACRRWLKRVGVASVRRGRFILVDGLDIDRVLRKS